MILGVRLGSAKGLYAFLYSKRPLYVKVYRIRLLRGYIIQKIGKAWCYQCLTHELIDSAPVN